MIVVSIFGGIGNQMFQYAFGRALSASLNTDFKYDYSYNLIRNDFNPSDIQSIFNLFNLKGQQASDEEIRKFGLLSGYRGFNKYYQFVKKFFFYDKNYIHIVERDTNFNSSVFTLKDKNLYLSGYWQSEKYFLEYSNEIKNDFSFKESLQFQAYEWANVIQKSESVSIHLRGRDYLTSKATSSQHLICDIEYYSQAISYFKKKYLNPTFFVFSDDPTWAKSYLKSINNNDIVFIEGNQWNVSPINDMYLMSLCKHNIIANSSFSWWAAWLNNNRQKTIICPKKWFNMKLHNIDEIAPQSWIKI